MTLELVERVNGRVARHGRCVRRSGAAGVAMDRSKPAHCGGGGRRLAAFADYGLLFAAVNVV